VLPSRTIVTRALPILLIVVVTAATFARAVGNDFVSWDDRETIAQNGLLDPPTWRGVAHYWRNPAGGLYVPVTYTFWSMLATIDGRDARVYHAASVLLHAGAAVLVFAVARQLVDGDVAACAGALVFAVHPVQVESIAWASGAKDVLAGTFSLAMIDQFLRFSTKRQAAGGAGGASGASGAGGGGRGRWHYATSLLLFVLAILSKPSAIVAPLLALVLALVLARSKHRGPLRAHLVPLAPMLILAIACAAWSRAAQAQYAPTDTPPWTRPLVALDALAFYLCKVFWPTRLTIIYGRTPETVMATGVLFYTWMVPAIVGAGAFAVRRRIPLIWTGLVTFVVALLPVLGFARFMFQIHSTVADHYLYLPMLGVALAIAGFVARRTNPLTISTAAVVVLALSIASVRQLWHWRDSEALYARVVRLYPNNAFARAGLGRAYAESDRVRDAIPQFEAAVRLSSGSHTAHALLAQAYLRDGRADEAERHAAIALRLAAPGDDTSWERFILDAARAARAAQATQPTGP
jgi:tetratricopeptide (TPR) repeat protein